MKLVSVVLPTYNGERWLRQSIESVLSQTYNNLELIIVNDCSSDSTKEVAEEYVKKDSRVQLINNEVNKKLPASLNIGFAQARGEYLTWTSDDNWYDPEAFEEMVEFLDNNSEYVMVVSNFKKVSVDGTVSYVTVNPTPQKMIKSNSVGACFMYRSSVAKEVGEYNVNKFLIEDYDYWLRMCLIGKIGHINSLFYNYRVHEKSLTTQRAKEVQYITAKELRELLPLFKEKYPDLDYTIVEHEIAINEFYSGVDKSGAINKFGLAFVIKYIIKIVIRFCKRLLRKIYIRKKTVDYNKNINLAKKWISKYTVDNHGIAVESNQPKRIYPEVTGYYIPTLLRIGDKERAKNYGDYLLTIQNDNGSWNDPSGTVPYTFDTAQILKGLSALIENNMDTNDRYKTAFLKGCDWVLTQQRCNGSIATPDYSCWALPYGKCVPEAIHVYCLEPLRKATEFYGIEKYENCVKKALNYYLAQENLTDFSTLSHFNAYIIEGLIDLGETERAKRAMDLITLHQRVDGSVPAYSNVDFVCSTGLMQYSICWYKLGEIEKANKAFDYACRLQNKSGGWYGSYGKNATYFPHGEIAWAVKYFFDALLLSKKVNF